MTAKPPRRPKRPPGRTVTNPPGPRRSQAFSGAPKPGNRAASRPSRTANVHTLSVQRPRFCIGCGCTDNQACVSDLGEPCHWVAADNRRGVCSECATRMCTALLANVHSQDADSEGWPRPSDDLFRVHG